MKKLYILLLLILFVGQSSFAKTYVLVHGAFQDGTSWDKIKAKLEKANNKVLVVSRNHYKGSDISDITLDTYVKQVVDIINEQSEKVILVAQSMGGIIISAVAEQVSDKIAYLVYITAIIPESGDSVFGFVQRNPNPTKLTFINLSEDKTYATLNEETAKADLCADCPEEVMKLYFHNQENQIEPMAPFNEKVTLTDSNFNRIPKIVIQTRLDHANTFEFQKLYTAKAKNVKQVYQIKSSHMPQFSKPNKLSKILLCID